MTKPTNLSQKVISDIAELRENDKFTDLTITHDSRAFSVHRIIVCAQSKVLYKACDGGFKEQFEGVIDMGHVPYRLLERLISFFYNMEYDEAPADSSSESTLQLHAQMFALADEYDIPELLLRAERKYWERCIKAWDSLEFLLSVPVVFEATPGSLLGLRQAACVAVRRYLPGMLEDAIVAKSFEKTLRENPAFAKRLLESYIETPLFGYCQTCRSDHAMEPLQTRCQKCNKGQGGLLSHWHSTSQL
ncbi:hypothetical protein E8E12_002363 [Didymella heteroderae]|uniref:BTB domain-containing protein n=1 Tax=Didymella heteroderae TaxID=1769908 RepID=A0A9P4WGK2_9PLEO|nr:hypothetical protein E8E12_002363 [Didymella heteroderae]